MNRISGYLLCVSLFILHGIATAQINSVYNEYHLIQRSPAASLSKIGAASWLAGSSGVTDAGVLSASFNNPAALRFESWKVTAEFTYRAKARYFDVVNYDNIYFPSFFSIGFGNTDMNFTINYFRQYAQYVESDPFEVTTVDQPDGTGERFAFETEVDIQSFAGTVQYSLTDNVGIGATVGGNYLNSRDGIWHTYLKLTGWSLLAIAGVYAATDDLSFGASIRYSSPFSIGGVETNANTLSVIDPSHEVEIRTNYFARLPIVYQAGISLQALPFLRISVSDELQNWTFVHSSYDNISNLHVGIVASPVDNVDLLFGYSEQFDPQSAQTDQIFFTSGINIRVEGASLTIGISDSDTFRSKRRAVYFSQPKEPFRQFIVLSAVTYSF